MPQKFEQVPLLSERKHLLLWGVLPFYIGPSFDNSVCIKVESAKVLTTKILKTKTSNFNGRERYYSFWVLEIGFEKCMIIQLVKIVCGKSSESKALEVLIQIIRQRAGFSSPDAIPAHFKELGTGEGGKMRFLDNPRYISIRACWREVKIPN